MSLPKGAEQGLEAAAKTYVASYAGLTIGGVSLPDVAAILAILTSLCLLAQYGYKFWHYCAKRWRA